MDKVKGKTISVWRGVKRLKEQCKSWGLTNTLAESHRVVINGRRKQLVKPKPHIVFLERQLCKRRKLVCVRYSRNERRKTMIKLIKRIIFKIRHKRFCKLNNYFCPDCIYHDFIFEGSEFRGNRCRFPKPKGFED